MSLIKVKEYFEKYGIKDRIIELDESSATVEQAAKALGTENARIAKSLTFKVDEDAIMIVMAGDAKIDNSKYKQFFGTKAKMLTYDEVEEYIGHQVGGVCPFALKPSVKVYLEESLKRFATVFPACGSKTSAIELSLEELEGLSNYISYIDVCKDWQ